MKNELTLEEKGVAIMETIAHMREIRARQDSKLEQLERIARFYALGIDPKNIDSHRKMGRERVLTMKDGSTHTLNPEDSSAIFPQPLSVALDLFSMRGAE